MNSQFELEVGDEVAVRRKDQLGVINGPREVRGFIIHIHRPWWAAFPRYYVRFGYGDSRRVLKFRRSEIRYVDPALEARLDEVFEVTQ